MKSVLTAAYKSAMPNWYHGSHGDFDQWDEVAAEKVRGKRKGVDQLGQWFTDKPEYAAWYGPNIREYDFDLNNPYVPDTTHFPHAFYVRDLAARYLTAKEMQAMNAGPPPEKVLRDLERRLNRDGFLLKPDLKNYERLRKQRRDYDKVAEKLFKKTDYVTALRKRLQEQGHDSVLFPNSDIDAPTGKERHNVAILLDPSKQKARRKIP
jgi:hypothetical protein